MSYKATKPGSVLSVSVGFMCILLFIRDTFVLTLVCVCMCSVSWLLLVKLSLLAKWLARKTPLRKPNRGEGIVSTKPRPKSVYDFLGLLCCFVVYLYDVYLCCPRPYVIYFILLWRDIGYLCQKCRYTTINQAIAVSILKAIFQPDLG